MEVLQPSWRGKNLNTRKDERGKYAAMMGTDALLYVPVKVEENSTYKIQIEAARSSGNGIVFCNIYGNKNFDFPQASFCCSTTSWKIYTFEIQTKSFPRTVPMVFRLWRKPKGNGSVLIRRIIVEMVYTEDDNIPKKIIENVPMDDSGNVIQKEIAGINEIHIPNEKKKKRFSTQELEHIRKKQKARRLKNKLNKEITHEKPVNKKIKRIKKQKGARKRVTPLQPIELPDLVPGSDGIKNSVIISLKDRAEFLDRTLYTYDKQTMPKEEFELIIIDDNSTEDILSVCKKHSEISGLRFQYINIDTKKGAFIQKGFTPALSNNIGFKNARGSVLIITGPETLQGEKNLEYTWEACNGPKCVYGVVHRSNINFVDELRDNENWYHNSFDEILKIRGAQHQQACLNGFWWYYAAARKEYILNINGVDERYMEGISAEDDDFAERMRQSGITLLHDRRIIGIHQDHLREDKNHPDHQFRFNKKEWNRLRNHNCNLLTRRMNDLMPKANQGIDWGTFSAIKYLEIF